MPKSLNGSTTKHEKITFRYILETLSTGDFVQLQKWGDIYFKKGKKLYFAELKLHQKNLSVNEMLRGISQLFKDYINENSPKEMSPIFRFGPGGTIDKKQITQSLDLPSEKWLYDTINEKSKSKLSKIFYIEDISSFSKMISNLKIIKESYAKNTKDFINKDHEYCKLLKKSLSVKYIQAQKFTQGIDAQIDNVDNYKLQGGIIKRLITLSSSLDKINNKSYKDFISAFPHSKLKKNIFDEIKKSYLNALPYYIKEIDNVIKFLEGECSK